jgi:hypothetical protein
MATRGANRRYFFRAAAATALLPAQPGEPDGFDAFLLAQRRRIDQTLGRWHSRVTKRRQERFSDLYEDMETRGKISGLCGHSHRVME